jgi:hypothetical protein
MTRKHKNYIGIRDMVLRLIDEQIDFTFKAGTDSLNEDRITVGNYWIVNTGHDEFYIAPVNNWTNGEHFDLNETIGAMTEHA